MASVNKVILVGNCGRDPEIRYLPSGSAVANVTVATSSRRKDKNSGEMIEDTQWHRVTFFERLAEIVGEYVKKGSPIYVEGRLRYSTYMDKTTMAMMRKQGTYFVPTISAGKWAEEKSRIAGFFPDLVRPKAATIGGKIQDTFAAAYKAGVKIAFGTDAGVFEHGNNWREFIYMTEVGMPAMEAIQSATIEGARLLGVEAELGSIKVGKIADIIAVPGDPLQDIQLMGQVNFVMKAGQIYKK